VAPNAQKSPKTFTRCLFVLLFASEDQQTMKEGRGRGREGRSERHKIHESKSSVASVSAQTDVDLGLGFEIAVEFAGENLQRERTKKAETKAMRKST